MQSTIDNVPHSLQENRHILEEQEKLHTQLSELMPTWQDVTRLQGTEIPQIQQRLATIQEQITGFQDEIKEV